MDEIGAHHLPELPESEYAVLTACFREIDRRANELGRRFHDKEVVEGSGREILVREFPERARERASDAYAEGIRIAAS